MRKNANRMDRHRNNDIKNFIIALIFLMIVIMTAAYAMYSRQLVIDSFGRVNNDWDVRITDTRLVNETGFARQLSSPIISPGGLGMTIEIMLAHFEDEITYDIEITNFSGMWDAEYIGFTTNMTATDFIDYEIEGILVGDIIPKDNTQGDNPMSITIQLIAFWNPLLINDLPELKSHTEMRTILLNFEATR